MKSCPEPAQKKAKKEKKIWTQLIVNAALFSIALGIYSLIIRLLYSSLFTGFFLLLQEGETASIAGVQSLLGVEVVRNGATLAYDEFSVVVSADCIGLRPALFALVLLFSFYQVGLKERAWGLWIIPIMLALNMLRVSLLYPLFLSAGYEKTIAFHNFMFTYGNGMSVLILFVIWYYLAVELRCPSRKSRAKKIR